MRLGERVLLLLSRAPGTGDYAGANENWTLDNALSQLERNFPNLRNRVSGKHVFDLGCGAGWQSVALARCGAASVLGLDTNQCAVEEARGLARAHGVATRVEFTTAFEERFRGRFDVVISQNSMEHVGDPDEAVAAMKAAVREEGEILITFGPPWCAPYGSHMHMFTRVPWVNLIFSERTVMNVRARFRSDGALKYEEGSLNRMTVAKFERIVAGAGLRIRHKKYRCVKGMNALARLPVLRELFINEISCALSSG